MRVGKKKFVSHIFFKEFMNQNVFWTGRLPVQKRNPKWIGDWYWFHLKWISEYAGCRPEKDLVICSLCPY